MHEPSARRIAHHAMRAAILAGFAWLIADLARSGEIGLYIAPRMAPYVKLSALGLYAVAAYQAYLALKAWLDGRSAEQCGCGHVHGGGGAKRAIGYALFLLPLAVGFVLPDTPPGSALAAAKGVQFESSERLDPPAGGTEPSAATAPGAAAADSQDALFPADEYTEAYAAYAKRLYTSRRAVVEEPFFIESLTALDLYRDRLQGIEVEIGGFVYREEAMGQHRFAVSRFVMNCCSADSLPYGMIVEWPNAARYEDDAWVRVTGTLGLDTYMDNEVMLLRAAAVERIEAPETPYVYPNYAFGPEMPPGA